MIEGDRNSAEGWQQRRCDRSSTLLMAEAIIMGTGHVLKVRVRNLSPYGLMAECQRPPLPGEKILVSLRNIGQISSRIIWSQAGRIGIEFDQEIDPNLALNLSTGGKQSGDSVPQYLRILDNSLTTASAYRRPPLQKH